MRYRPLLILLFSFFLTYSSCPSFAEQGIDTLFDEANRAYSKGEFTTAADLYEKIITNYGYSSGVLYNLANSYARLDRTGDAVLHYERALRLAPGDSDITNNLRMVKTKNGLFEQEKQLSQAAIHLLDLNQWALLAAAVLGTFTILLLLSCWYTQLRKHLLPLGLCCSVLIGAALYSAQQLYSEWNGCIVVTPGTRMMISPFEGAASIGDIKEGRTVVFHKGKSHGEYSYVEDKTGRQGWILNSAIKPIIPE